MARFAINDYISLGCKGYPNAASWQVALDGEFEHIIDESLNDKVNVHSWISPLPKIDGSGYYADLDEVHARVKYHIDGDESEWFVLTTKNQNDQEFIITENKEIIETLNSIEAGIN